MEIKINDPIDYGGAADLTNPILPCFIEIGITANNGKLIQFAANIILQVFSKFNIRGIVVKFPIAVNKLEDIEKSWTEKGFEVIKNY